MNVENAYRPAESSTQTPKQYKPNEHWSLCDVRHDLFIHQNHNKFMIIITVDFRKLNMNIRSVCWVTLCGSHAHTLHRQSAFVMITYDILIIFIVHIMHSQTIVMEQFVVAGRAHTWLSNCIRRLPPLGSRILDTSSRQHTYTNCIEMDKLICLAKVKATSLCTARANLSEWFYSFARFSRLRLDRFESICRCAAKVAERD